MTRAERLAQTEARARVKLDAQRTRLAQVQAAQREEERKALTKRRLLVGKLVDEAGLFSLDNATLAGLFARLTALVEAPDPVAVLDALLRDGVSPVCVSVPGCVQAAPGVAPAEPLK
jgi:hypothetical protein